MVTAEVLLSMLVGRSSQLFSQLYAEGIIDNSFSWITPSIGTTPSSCSTGGRLTLRPSWTGSPGVRAVPHEGPDAEALERTRRFLMGTWLKEFNSLEAIAYQCLTTIF